MSLTNVIDFLKHKVASVTKTISLPDDIFTQVISRVSKLIWPEGGWQAAGYDEDYNYVILSRKTGQFRHLKPRDLNPKTIRAVLGAEFCKKYCRRLDPETQQWVEDYRPLFEEIVNECEARGLFSLDGVRGPGFYRDGDELTVNYGYEVRTAEGKEVDVTPTPDRTYVAGKPLDISPDTSSATNEDIHRALEVFNTFAFAKARQLVFTLGWLVSRFYGIALHVHPLLVVEAEPKSGKSTLLTWMIELLGAQALYREGIPAKAQVIYALENTQKALFCDEVGVARDSRRAFKDLEELARIGFTSSLRERITRVIGGILRVFNAPVGVLFAGASTPALTPATESRAIRVQLKEPEVGKPRQLHPLLNPDNREELLGLGRRLRKLMLERWSVMRDAQKVFCNQLLARKHAERTAAKYAVVLAGYVTFTKGAVPTTEEADSLICEVGLERPEEQVVDRDYDVGLNTLMDSNITVQLDVPGARKTHLTIGGVVRRIITAPEAERRSLSAQLEEFGLRVDLLGAWKLTVSAAANHPRLSALFNRSQCAQGAWKEVFLRVPGAVETTQRFGSGKRPQRAVRFDVPGWLLSADDEGENPQAV